MTMPAKMNCPHSPDGWCLDCVGEQVAEIERLSGEIDDLAVLARVRLRAIGELGDAAMLLRSELAALKSATPLCEEHAPKGGARSGCPYCAIRTLYAALSAIDLAVHGDNEMHTSLFDVDCDEDRVVRDVVAALKPITDQAAEIERLKKENKALSDELYRVRTTMTNDSVELEKVRHELGMDRDAKDVHVAARKFAALKTAAGPGNETPLDQWATDMRSAEGGPPAPGAEKEKK